jgi:hypothetical protein
MLWLLLTSCVRCQGELHGPRDALAPGASVSLEPVWEGEAVDPCTMRWFVDGIEGGDEGVGTITDCGRYTAPESPPESDPVVLGADFAPGTCADCCPSASAVIPLLR